MKKSKFPRFLSALGAIMFWILVWALLARAVGQELLLPSPLQVVKKLLALCQTRDFWVMTGRSILRVLVGLLAATVLGVLLAALSHRSRLAEALLAPLMTLVKSTPVASFIVLALIWLGRGTVPAFITGLIVVPVVWANLTAALRQVDPQLKELARVYALPRGRVLRRVTVPSVLPAFRASLCSALGLGWKAGVAAEVLTVPRESIGRMIYESKLYLETTELFAWTVTVVLLSLLIERLLLLAVSKGGRKGGAAHA